MVWLWPAVERRRAPACNWWPLGWGSPGCPFAYSFEGEWGDGDSCTIARGRTGTSKGSAWLPCAFLQEAGAGFAKLPICCHALGQ